MTIAGIDTEPIQDCSLEAGPESLAFLLQQSIDLTSIRTVRDEVLAFAGLLNMGIKAGSEALESDFKTGMIEALAQMEQAIRTENGTLVVMVPKGFGAFSAHFPAVSTEYGSAFSIPNPDDSQVLLIPTSKITAASALPYPSSPGTSEPQYHPGINLRIQTPTDIQATYYAAPGEVELVPNVGRWLHLPLSLTQFAFLVGR